MLPVISPCNDRADPVVRGRMNRWDSVESTIASNHSGKQVCILDSETNVSQLAAFLVQNGCRVTRCTSCGARCAEEETDPDVILLNASDGEPAVQRIRTLPGRSGSPPGPGDRL